MAWEQLDLEIAQMFDLNTYAEIDHFALVFAMERERRLHREREKTRVRLLRCDPVRLAHYRSRASKNVTAYVKRRRESDPEWAAEHRRKRKEQARRRRALAKEEQQMKRAA